MGRVEKAKRRGGSLRWPSTAWSLCRCVAPGSALGALSAATVASVRPPLLGRTLRRWARQLRGWLLFGILLALSVRLLAASLLLLASLGAVLGPTPATWLRASAWAVGGSLLVLAVRPSFHALRDAFSGTRFVEWVRPRAPELASVARSALDLCREGPMPVLGSEALVHAHVQEAERRLGRIAPRRILHWRALLGRREAMWFLGGVLGGAALLLWPRARAGAWALWRGTPRISSQDASEREAVRAAWVVDGVRWRLTPPDYAGGEAVELRDEPEVSVLAGTTLRLRFEALPPGARSVRLRVGERSWRGARLRAGRFEVGGRLLSGGEVQILVEDGKGRWWRDARRRRVSVRPDRPPEVHLGWADGRGAVGRQERRVAPTDSLRVRWGASDDLCLSGVSLVLRLRGGPERRRSLWEAAGDEGSAHRSRGPLKGRIALTLAEVEAQPGDRYELFVEASDCDRIQGPKRTRSRPLRLVVPSEADDLGERGVRWHALRGKVLDTLAWEMASEDAEKAPSVLARRLARGVVHSVRRAEPLPVSTLLPVLREAVRRERGASWRVVARQAIRVLGRGQRGDTQRRGVLEELALALDDALEALGRREAALRLRRLARLEAGLRRAANAFARNPRDERLARRLQEAVARIEQEMARAAAARGRSVSRRPTGFRNAIGERLPQPRYEALASLRDAASRGDAASALEAVRGVSQDLERLASALQTSSEERSGEGGGRRARRLAEAVRRLAELEREQGALLERTEAARRESVVRALRRLQEEGLETGPLGERASATAESARRMASSVSSGGDRAELRSAAERLSEVASALRAMEVGEALRLVREADGRLEEIARSMRLEATMFPGHEGRTARAAARAERLAAEARSLRSALEELIAEASESGTERLHGSPARNAASQRRLVEGVRRLAERLKDVGVPAKPAGPISEAMERARRRLKASDVLRAERHQREAAERLGAWRRRLERMGGGGGADREDAGQQGADGSDAGGGGVRRSDRRVRISLERERASGAFLERLREAMREEVDPAFEDAVRDYYEGLMR